MRILIAMALVAVAVLAQDADKLVQKANKLETRAAKALDAGRNIEAFELLAQAEELRRQARAATPARPAPQEKRAAPVEQPRKKKKKVSRAPQRAPGLAQTFASLDRAIEKGDQAAARKASRQLKKLVRGMGRKTTPEQDKLLLERIERLEKQVNELRLLLSRIER